MKNSTPVSLSVVIVHHDENERRILRDSFGALPDVHVAGERSDLESGMTLARQVAPAILVLELPRNPEETLAATGEFRLEYPDSAIVYSSDRLDADTVLRALRAGATEVLARPFHPDTLTATWTASVRCGRTVRARRATAASCRCTGRRAGTV
jgi:DNA-binding NarL/FixJ family response regulator